MQLKTDAFSMFHPAVNFCFFGTVIGMTMFLMHPVFLAVSLLCAGAYLLYLRGVRGFVRQVGYLLPVLLFTAALNPMFNHEGATVLFELPNGSPVTWESLCFGVASSVMMGATILWFNCCSVVFTTDKIIYLFGRIIPSLSLLISMTLRFVPRFKDFLMETMRVQRLLAQPKSGMDTLKQAFTAFSATVSWAMEQSIVTADSMKSRGYGGSGRTAYSICRFERRDLLALVFLAGMMAAALTPLVLGTVKWEFFPAVNGRLLGVGTVLSYACFAAICLMPLMIDLMEDCKWNSLRSGI